MGYNPPPETLNAVFSALADPTRRQILARLSDGPASVGELAEPFDISQPAVSKHLKSLERAGLIHRDIDKQRRPATLNAAPMKAAIGWLEEFRKHWDVRLDRLDDLLEDLKSNADERH
ncbi:MAG: metalloregulator ArsR/SmtB family transcription factor [Boseongicola sp.]|nr:MAG: metalloregulator ArsR/SmtB family transcription factor [Boseongicola sp.]